MWGVWGERELMLLHPPTPPIPSPSSHTSHPSHTSHTSCLPHTPCPMPK
nr:hypothetical protein [Nostoc sp. ChiSLP01]